MISFVIISDCAAGSIDAIQWPASLNCLTLANNPDLHGTVTKKLVLQCSNGIMFAGCKPKYGAGGKMNEEFLSFPYLVGMTFSSQNIDDIMRCRDFLGMDDSMITEPPAVEITEEHGKKQKLCPWQKTWLDPLLKLRNCNIYVKSSTPEGDRYGIIHQKKGYSFKEKFLNFARFADHDENMRRDSFDAACGLPEGERAVSILDWERRIFLLVAKTNNLTIVHVKDGMTPEAMGYDIDWEAMGGDGKCIYKLNGEPTSPEWYCHYPEAEAEAIRRFKTRKMALA